VTWRERYRALIKEHEDMIASETVRLDRLQADIRALHEEAMQKSSPLEDTYSSVATSIHRRRGAITQLLSLLGHDDPEGLDHVQD